ncbi:DUF6176 family protein [Cohnella ginsengisoli]|uniref:DUF6176 family protein n=1 Tax=Cohnella ginsengisoli TaxID=425004 RepID=A0A9X4KK22_9BACL|nr:DUF6176 family protein [Cohnella ginsengisoli]MDG0793438.1 DUF6176 family protein [Cohnella ginsengisoli]
MEVQCLKVKIKPGMTQEFIDFVKDMQVNKMDFVYETMRSENIVVESIFLEKGEEADHIIFYTRSNPADEAIEEGPDRGSAIPVDTESIEMLQKTWDSVQSLEVLFDAGRLP